MSGTNQAKSDEIAKNGLMEEIYLVSDIAGWIAMVLRIPKHDRPLIAAGDINDEANFLSKYQ